MMQRRGFLGAILAAAAGPAIVRAESLMKIAPKQIWMPPTFTEGRRLAGEVLLGDCTLSGTIIQSQNVQFGAWPAGYTVVRIGTNDFRALSAEELMSMVSQPKVFLR